MIDIHKSVHDDFTVEFKMSYHVEGKSNLNDFHLKIWIFAPNSLALNNQTYKSDLFYRDLKISTRLITPIYSLKDIRGEYSTLFQNISDAFIAVVKEESTANIVAYKYHIKMFLAIVRSSTRDAISHIKHARNSKNITHLIFQYIEYIKDIVKKYRALKDILDSATTSAKRYSVYSFGDEFLSNMVDFYTLEIINKHNKRINTDLEESHSALVALINSERDYRKSKKFIVLDKNSKTNNREYLFRITALKQFINNDLFLNTEKKEDAMITKQIYYSLAAGISMVFATAIAFSFQRKFGNYTMPLFVALIVSYMLKDRIKDFMKYFFASKRKTLYYDNKTTISVGDTKLGWSRESYNFTLDDKVPPEVIDMRSRTPLINEENEHNNESIILYRKHIRLKKSVLDNSKTYKTTGVNEIIRFNIAHLMNRMDDPKEVFNLLDENGNIDKIKADKIYYINYIIETEYNNKKQYKRYKVVCTRDKIIGIDDFSN